MSVVEGLDLILQAGATSHERRSCRAWVGIPLVQPARIVVIGDGSLGAEALADALADAVATLVGQIAAGATATMPPCGGSHGPDCAAGEDSRVRNLLVWVGDGVSPASYDGDALTLTWTSAGHPALAVLPLGSDISRVLPPSLRALHTSTWEHDVAQAAYGVLIAAGVVPAENRVFVSYRHGEGDQLAWSLFRILSERRFDVFLDRFSLAPAADFQERIEQELVDKAFVLVVETDTTRDSDWIDYEVGFARTHGLGIATVNDGAPGSFGIAEAQRIRLARGEFGGNPPALSQAARDRVIQRVEELHGLALVDRRRRLEDSLRLELAQRIDPSRMRRVRGGVDVAGSSAYAIDVCVRPPRLEAYRTVGRRAGAAGATAALVAPRPVAADRRDALAWLEATSGVSRWDEGDLAQLADAIAAGRAP